MGFSEALAFTLDEEKGWYDGSHPSDPNPTMKGITQRTYNKWRDAQGLPHRTVREVEDHEVAAIYRTYWDAVRGDELPEITAAAVFDMAVNAGPPVAVRLLQRAVQVDADGVLGPQTLSAVTQLPDDTLAHRFNTQRYKHYVRLARNNHKFRAVLPTWIDRVSNFAERFLTD